MKANNVQIVRKIGKNVGLIVLVRQSNAGRPTFALAENIEWGPQILNWCCNTSLANVKYAIKSIAATRRLTNEIYKRRLDGSAPGVLTLREQADLGSYILAPTDEWGGEQEWKRTARNKFNSRKFPDIYGDESYLTEETLARLRQIDVSYEGEWDDEH